MATQKIVATDGRATSRRLRWILPSLFGLLLMGLVWLSYSANPTIVALRNTLHYRVIEAFGGPRVRLDEPPGIIVGTVRNEAGAPVAGATVLVASPLGHVYSAESDSEGGYRLAGVMPGRYVPVAGKRGFDDALPQSCLAGLCWKHAIKVRPDREAPDVDLTLFHAGPPQIVVDDSLIISPTVQIEVGAPFPSQALRTSFSFERAGLRVNDCHLYEPIEIEGALPAMLLVLPGPVAGWEIIPVPFASQGFSVLACYPLRGIDLDADAADLLTALEYLIRGRLPSHADTEHLALVGASFTSLHAFRLLGMTDRIDVTLVLGGMVDGFLFRHDVETGTADTRPPFDQVLIALGFPHTSPELYFKYSTIFHLEGLPPVCLLHGIDDELSPFSQSVELAEELERRGMPYEFYAYEGLKHYFSTSADNATTQQMFQDSLGCLRRYLEGE